MTAEPVVNRPAQFFAPAAQLMEKRGFYRMERNQTDSLGAERVGKLLFRLSVPAITAQIINPVSYTHLDVYKRQLTNGFQNSQSPI